MAEPAPSSRNALWAGLAGFAMGAVFWHLVGFWSFVSQVAFNQDETKTPARLINFEEAKSVSVAGAGLVASAKPQDRNPSADLAAEAAPAEGDGLHELLQCSEVRRVSGEADVAVSACAPLARRLPFGPLAVRGDRQMDAREAEQHLLNGWSTGVSRIETGALD